MQTTSYSDLQSMKDCARKRYFQYERRLRPIDDAVYFRVGGMIHQGIDLHYKGKTPGEITAFIYSEYEKTKPQKSDNEAFQKWEIEHEIVLRMIFAYIWRWSETGNEIKVIASELPFTMLIENPETGRTSRTFNLCGVVDRVFRIPGNRIAIGELKTTADDLSTDSNFWRRLRLDSQISLYWLGAQSLGYEPETILYDVIRKPTIQPKTLTQGQTQELLETGHYFTKINGCENKISVGKYRVESWFDDALENDVVSIDGCSPMSVIPGKSIDKETGRSKFAIRESVGMFGDRLSADIAHRPEHYFARKEIPRLPSDIEDAKYGLWDMVRQIKDSQHHGHWPRNDRQCLLRGECPYFDLCTSGYGINETDIPEGFYIKEPTGITE